MELKKHREYQTIRLFAILGSLTIIIVLLFKLVLFAPHDSNISRSPTLSSGEISNLPDLQTGSDSDKLLQEKIK